MSPGARVALITAAALILAAIVLAISGGNVGPLLIFGGMAALMVKTS